MNTDKPVVKGPVDGNAFAIMGAVSAALRKAGRSREEIEEYRTKATSGDYNNLLRVSMDYVEFEI